MPRKKFNLTKMSQTEIYEYVIFLKKELNRYQTLYRKTQQRYQDMLLKYEKPRNENKEKNPYLIDDFTINIGS